MFYPLTFEPILMERVWGGRKLADLFGKPISPGSVVGESWELTDRPEGISVIAAGPHKGVSLRRLMEEHPRELVGGAATPGGRFPLLIKLLDAREKLSLQVHPPARLAAALRGEPKTEMWFVAEAIQEADLFVGLRRGVTREEFVKRVAEGTVAQCFHRIPVKAGDAMFLPSGRVHAIGGGSVIFEIQQNSDTTYRVFDWNRLGLDGKPRALHLDAALQCMDFNDFEPGLVRPIGVRRGAHTCATLVNDPLFEVEHWNASAAASVSLDCRGTCLVIGAIAGELDVCGGGERSRVSPGSFALVPACLGGAEVTASKSHSFLVARPGHER